jgi:hypothetical protein
MSHVSELQMRFPPQAAQDTYQEARFTLLDQYR